MAKRIAEAFRWGDEELAAVLLFRLADLKSKVRTDIHDWCAFVAQSLYNAAKNFIRREDVIRARQRSLDCTTGDSAGLLDHVAEPAEPTPNQCSFSDVRKRLTPEMRKLADLLIQNEGNISAVSKALGRPRKTVEYWVVKLRASLQKLGVEP